MRTLTVIAALFATALIVAWCFIDPYDRHSIVTGSVVLASSVAVFFGIFVHVRNMVTASVTAVGVAIILAIGWRISSPSHAKLERLAGPTIHALNEFHKEQGRYPVSLYEIEAQPPSTRFGEYNYKSERDGQDFTLEIGDYRHDLFTGYYSGSVARWHWDT